MQTETKVNDIIHKSEIPFHFTKRAPFAILFTFIAFDIFFVFIYFVSKLPEVQSLTINHRLAFLDLDVEANLPTNYEILKLYFSSIVSILMIYWYKNKAPIFWKVSALVLFITGLDESAQLHEVWAAGLATKLFGNEYLQGNQYTIIPYAIILGTFYLSSLALFPKESKLVFLCFFMAGILLILSQVVEWTFNPGKQIMFDIFNLFPAISHKFDQNTLMIAWEEGLEMLGYSLLCGGVMMGVYAIQSRGNYSAN